MSVQTLIDRAVERHGSQSALARALNVSVGNVNDWKHGRQPVPWKKELLIAIEAGEDLDTYAVTRSREIVGKASGQRGAGAISCLVGIAAVLAAAVLWGRSGIDAAAGQTALMYRKVKSRRQAARLNLAQSV